MAFLTCAGDAPKWQVGYAAGEKTALFVHFLYKNDHFTKTGSGQT